MPSTTITGATPAERSPSGLLKAALQTALRQDAPAVARLRHAGASVTFSVVGDDAVTLVLSSTPPQVTDGPGEIEIVLSPADARRFATGRLPMADAVVTRAVAYSGPVRRYLEVDPILRGLLARVADAGDDTAASATRGTAAREARPDTRVDPELLSIQTRGLRKAFGDHEVLAGVDLTIPEGAISVVLGPSGTGKSVLLQHILGLMPPDAGDVVIRGRALSGMSRTEVLGLRREIGVMFQDGALFSNMNLRDNVAFPLRQHTNLREDEIDEVVTEHLDGVGLRDAAHRMPSQLSGGMKKRAGLARALVLNPGIVLCDEPDSGLDPVRTALLGRLLVEQHAEYGGTMVVVTHNVPLAKAIADHISVLWRGTVLESGMAADVLASETPFVRQFLSGATRGPLSMDA